MVAAGDQEVERGISVGGSPGDARDSGGRAVLDQISFSTEFNEFRKKFTAGSFSVFT